MKRDSSHSRLWRIAPVLAISLVTILLMAGSLRALTGGAATRGSVLPADLQAGLPSLQAATVISQNVELISQLGGWMNTVAVQNNKAYVGIGLSLVILDIANPAHPVELGRSRPMPDIVSKVFVSGTLAYIADHTAGLRIMDVSDAASPVEIGSYTGPLFQSECVAVAGNYAYAGGLKDLRIIDVTNPANPQAVGTFETPRTPFGVAVSGRYAYIGVDRKGVWVLDVSDPAAPRQVGSTVSGYPFDMRATDDLLFVSDYFAGLRIINVVSPTNAIATSSFKTSGPGWGVAVAGTFAYVADLYGLSIIDISEPVTPTQTAYYSMTGGTVAVAAAGNRIYVAARQSGLHVIDVADPYHPHEIGFYQTPLVSPSRLAVAGAFAYIADDNPDGMGPQGLRIVNVSDPPHPFMVSSVDTPGRAQDVAVNGPYVYVADDTAGLRVVNALYATHPFEISSEDTPGNALGVALSGNYAYVADGPSGLSIIKIKDPANPSQVGAYNPTSHAQDVAIAGSIAYIANGSVGLLIVNVANPSYPTELGRYTLADARAVAIAGDYAYVADGSGGLHIIAVSDPTHPTETGSISTPGSANDVAVSPDGLAYVADGYDGLHIINVGDPAHPTEVGFYETRGNATGVAVASGLAYVACEYGSGLTILRYHPTLPTPSFFAAPTSGKRPLTVAFTDTSSGGVDTWLWNFGDGITSSLPNPTHTYTAVGAYTVSLSVQNANGSHTLTRPNLIAVTGMAAFAAGPTWGRPPLTVTFTNQSSGNYISSLWDFGDGITSTLTNPTHTYITQGAFTVTLTVSGPDGDDTEVKPTFIHVGIQTLYIPIVMRAYVPKLAGFDAVPTAGEAPLTVTFANTSVNYTTSLWDFGDGATSTLPNPTHVYVLPGVYTVTLTIAGPSGTDTLARASYITVHARATRVRYVAAGGMDNGNDCSHDALPCATPQYAVDKSVPGDEIRIAAGTYTDVSARPRDDVRTDGVVTQVVYLSKTVNLRGGYTTANWSVPDPTANPTILDAQGQGRVLYITGDISPTIEGLRLTGGKGSSDYPAGLGIGGGVYIISATATLTGCQIYNNTAEWQGGGVYLNHSPSILADSIISGNTASNGGGIYIEFSDATLRRNIIQGNSAHRIGVTYGQGGGLNVYASAATLSGNTVVGNTGYDGGGMYLSSGAATLSGNMISGNTAADGGGVFVVSESAATWSDNTLEGNVAYKGGGLYLWATTRTLLDSNTFRNNQADWGGGAYLLQSDVTLLNNIIADNQANTAGSGVYIEMGTSRLVHTTIARNSGGDGSGIYATNMSLVPSSVALTNTILVSHTVGIRVTGSMSVAVNVNGILWFNTPITMSQTTTATVTVQNQHEGDPAFAGSDDHIRPTSAAVNHGVADDDLLDIDGEYRPLAAPPDLGADEVISSPPVCAARLNGATVYTRLQAAINASASTTDMIEVAGMCEDTVTWNGNLYVAVLTKTLTVRGGYGPGFVWDPVAYPTVLNGHRRGGVLAIGAGTSPVVEYLTLLGGQAMEGGGLWSAGDAPVLRHLQLAYNYAGRGGGLYLRGMGGRLETSRIQANRASLGGGLVLKQTGAVIVSENTLQGNAAIKGGGALLDSTSSATTLNSNTILGNVSNSFGGGLYLRDSTAMVQGNSLHDNTAEYDGGGVSLERSAATLSGNTIISNTGYSGGGVHLGSSAATLSNNTVQNNTSEFNGGGIYMSDSPAMLRDNSIANNKTLYHGGGIYLYASAATLSGNTVLSNTVSSQADGRGGGVFLESSAATLENNIIAYNTARQWGGGIHVTLGSATLISNTLYNNAAHVGGGIYVNSTRNATLTGNTIFSNTTNMTGPGGGMFIANSEATLARNLVFSNTASSGGGAYLTDSKSVQSDNRIFRNVAQSGGGMYLNRSSVKLVNNVIADNRAGVGSGVTVEASQPQFLHTTIVRNNVTGDGDGSGISVTKSSYGWDASVITLTNTILVSHSVGISMTDGNTLTVNSVLWFGTPITLTQTTTATVSVQNQYEGDPAFAADGYHLTASSAAIDRGVDAGVPTDIDGIPRPQGTSPDLGAVEYIVPSQKASP